MNTCFRKMVTGVFVSLIGLFLLGSTYTKLNAASLPDGIPPFPDTVEVEMHELDAYGNLKSTFCTPGNENYGIMVVRRFAIPLAIVNALRESTLSGPTRMPAVQFRFRLKHTICWMLSPKK